MILKRRQLLLATLVIALGAAVFVNWYYTRVPAQEANGSTSAAEISEKQSTTAESERNLGDAQYVNANTQEVMKQEYFASAKLRRGTAHEQAKQELQKIINDKNADKAAVDNANRALADIAAAIKTEADLETLISAKLGSECIVILSGDSAQVVLGQNDPDAQSILQVQEMVMKQTKLPAEKITIIERNG